MAGRLTGPLSLQMSHTKPYIRKKAVLIMYKVFLKYPESLRPAFPRLKEKLEDPDPGSSIGAGVAGGAGLRGICEPLVQDAARKALKGHWVPVSRPGISPDSASFPSATCFPRSGLEPTISPRSLAPFVGVGFRRRALGAGCPLAAGLPFLRPLSRPPPSPHWGVPAVCSHLSAHDLMPVSWLRSPPRGSCLLVLYKSFPRWEQCQVASVTQGRSQLFSRESLPCLQENHGPWKVVVGGRHGGRPEPGVPWDLQGSRPQTQATGRVCCLGLGRWEPNPDVTGTSTRPTGDGQCARHRAGLPALGGTSLRRTPPLEKAAPPRVVETLNCCRGTPLLMGHPLFHRGPVGRSQRHL